LILDKEKINKILLIKFGGMGDVLLTTPVLPNLKEYFPNAVIYFLTLRQTRDILMDNYYISRVITYDKKEDKSLFLIKHVRKQKFDLVIDLFCNPRTAFFTFCSGAKYRFGFDFRGRGYAYNIKMKGRGGKVHNVEFNLDALRKLEIPITLKKLNISVNVVHEEFANDFINKHNIASKNIIGISMTGNWEAKKYKTNDYIEVVNKINKIYDVNFILIWGNENEKKECEKVQANFKDNSFVIPDSPIRYLAAIIKKCDLIIGNDSGPMHIAVTQGVPVLGIYGPTDQALQGPYGENNLTVVNANIDCLYCNLLDCKIGNVCMTELSKDLIIEKLNELIKVNNLKISLN
jgi:ADP-heptose:LPS heptosyltransferase